jgi:hypothetical protein
VDLLQKFTITIASLRQEIKIVSISTEGIIPDHKTYLNKKGLKVARRGLFNTAALYIADCILAPR